MKYEWRKQDKALYLSQTVPTVITVPEYSYYTLCGQGNPNSADFGEAIGALYALSYAVKMMPKRGSAPEGYYDYTVFPLEGVWDLIDRTKANEPLDKNNLKYTIMIRQPSFVTDALAEEIIAYVREKKPNPFLANVRFEHIEDGLCLQMRHLGSFDSEPASFARMQQYCEDNGCIRTSKTHKEIYLTDARRTAPEKRKTTLRFSIEQPKKTS